MKKLILFTLLSGALSTTSYPSPTLKDCGAGYTEDLKKLLQGVISCSDPFADPNMRNIYNQKCKQFNCGSEERVFEIFLNLPPLTSEEKRSKILKDMTCKNNLAKAIKKHAKLAASRNSKVSRNCSLDSNYDLKVNKNIRETDPQNIPRLATQEEALDCVYVATQVIYPGTSGCGSTPACIATVYCQSTGVVGTAMCDASNNQCPDVSICTDNSRPSPSWLNPYGGSTNTTIIQENVNRAIKR